MLYGVAGDGVFFHKRGDAGAAIRAWSMGELQEYVVFGSRLCATGCARIYLKRGGQIKEQVEIVVSYADFQIDVVLEAREQVCRCADEPYKLGG